MIQRTRPRLELSLIFLAKISFAYHPIFFMCFKMLEIFLEFTILSSLLVLNPLCYSYNGRPADSEHHVFLLFGRTFYENWYTYSH